ncbi:MAG TPA: hypothetical protein VD906_00730 [Caulobacteraceae bacterium]|nr:hypothetical protein [Caulobacteraceae bacterium]
MRSKLALFAALAVAAPLAVGCASDGQTSTGTTPTSTSAGATAGTDTGGTTTGTSGGATTGTSGGSGLEIPSLVNVNLENVLNDLSVRLNIDRANVPVNIQLPISLAANVCGVSINILSVSTGGQAQCTATTASQELAQQVQQQMAAGGSVGGGAQAGSNTVGGTTTTGTGSTTGAEGTTGTSTGADNSSTETDETP